MQYTFTAIKTTGAKYEAKLEAENKIELGRILKEKNGDMLLTAKEETKNSFNLNFLSRITTQDLIAFCRNMSGLMNAGVALARSVEILKKQTVNPKMKKILNGILETIKSGGSFSDALAKNPKTFDTLFVSMMRAGEESGNLIGTLREVQVHLERSYNLKKKIKGAMTYPVVILSAMFIIGILMMKFVVPNLLRVFVEFKTELPLPTKIVIWLADAINNNFIYLVLGIIIIVTGSIYLSKKTFVKNIFGFVIIRLPVIGKIAKETLTARTARTMSSLLKSGVSVVRSLEITRDVLGNNQYKKVIEEAMEDIQKGSPMSRSFQKNPNLYPPMMGDMIEVGEESGKVGDMLMDVANFYEDEVDQKTKNLSTIIEPLLMLVIGGAVAFFAVAMMTPMYKMMENVS